MSLIKLLTSHRGPIVNDPAAQGVPALAVMNYACTSVYGRLTVFGTAHGHYLSGGGH